MIENRTITVDAETAGQRLDAFLVAQVPTTQRALALTAIERRTIRVDGKPEKKGYKVCAGDVVQIDRLMEAADWRAAPNPGIVIPVIHEDPRFLVIDKPAGMPAHPLDPDETNTVVSGLLARYPELAGLGPDPLFPAVVHRLDAETSGVMLVARDAGAYDELRRQFASREVAKQYIALVCGQLDDPNRLLRHYLIHSKGGAHKMAVVEGPGPVKGQEPMLAMTAFTVREALPRHTLLDITILTGVTHQIRCQLAAIGHPVAGDTLYGSREADDGYQGPTVPSCGGNRVQASGDGGSGRLPLQASD